MTFHDNFHHNFTTKLLEPIVTYIYTTFLPHFHHIYMTPNHWSQLQARFSLHFHHIFTTEPLEPIVTYIYTIFSLHFHHIYMSSNHWSQFQTRFSLHFHHRTIGTNCNLHLHHIFTTFTWHQSIGANCKLDFLYMFTTEPLEPIVTYIYTTFSLHFHHIFMSPNHWSQFQTRFSLHFHHIYTTHDATLAYKISMWWSVSLFGLINKVKLLIWFSNISPFFL